MQETPPYRRAEDLNRTLIDRLKSQGVISEPAVEAAFRRILRHHFLPDRGLEEVYQDEAIGTRYTETGEAVSASSQPTIMAIMLEALELSPGLKVLEIGTGSGYNAALIASLTGNPSTVFTVDISQALCDEAHGHLHSAGVRGVSIQSADGWLGWPEFSPFDRIIVTASAFDISPRWFEQLTEGGRIVLPWGGAFQRTLAFRKERDALVLDGNNYCRFMRMRGHVDAAAVEDPSSADPIQTGEVWEATLDIPGDMSIENVDDFLFFLELHLWPLRPSVEFKQGGFDVIELLDGTGEPDAIIRSRPQWSATGKCNPSLSKQIQEAMYHWFNLGQPKSSRIQMTAHPHDSTDSLVRGELLMRRKWFDYVVSWNA